MVTKWECATRTKKKYHEARLLLETSLLFLFSASSHDAYSTWGRGGGMAVYILRHAILRRTAKMASRYTRKLKTQAWAIGSDAFYDNVLSAHFYVCGHLTSWRHPCSRVMTDADKLCFNADSTHETFFLIRLFSEIQEVITQYFLLSRTM